MSECGELGSASLTVFVGLHFKLSVYLQSGLVMVCEPGNDHLPIPSDFWFSVQARLVNKHPA